MQTEEEKQEMRIIMTSTVTIGFSLETIGKNIEILQNRYKCVEFAI